MDPINEALLAVMAGNSGDTLQAEQYLASARTRTQRGARRQRQVVEIASLVIAGSHERAAGLSLVHTAEFPEDLDLLARITGDHSLPETRS
jgi:hypothetical protein